MSSYLDQQNPRVTPQNEPIPGSNQTQNSAGGFAWEVDDWTRLHRFLIMGSEGGSYYAGERELTTQNVDVVRRCIEADGPRVVREVLEVSVNGRAPKQDPGVFVLALCASVGAGETAPSRLQTHTASALDSAKLSVARTRYERHTETRRQALAAVPHVCRYGTTLFMFARFCDQNRGWGRGLRTAIASWYTEPHFKTAWRAEGEEVTSSHVDDLAYQLVKYRQRDGYTHRDLLRLAHPKTEDEALANLLAWAAGKGDTVPKREGAKNPSMPKGWRRSRFPSSVIAYEAAQKAESSADIVKLLDVFGGKLPREAIPDNLKDALVWEALLRAGMPMGAMIRNLATMTRLGVLTPTSNATRIVVDELGDVERIRKARVHPIAVLSALLTYKNGRSIRGSSSWTPVPQVLDALDGAFYKSFDNVEPTGKRWLLGLDVSGSMNGGMVAGVPGLTPRVAAAAMAMVTAATGDPYEIVAFTSGGDRYSRVDWRTSTTLTPLTFSPRQRLDDICAATDRLPFGATDCALPMMYATQTQRAVDMFAIYTDSETWHGRIHPSQALRDYRAQSGINAKLAVVGMVSNGFSIADPTDPGMYDFVGFDTSTPAIMEAIAKE